MIFGVGVDIVSIKRINCALERSNGRLIKKILGLPEQNQYQTYLIKNYVRAQSYLATRFAAKEACAKALGIGLRWPMTWQSILVLNSDNGRPYLSYSSPLKSWLDERSLKADVSISDEEQYAVAYVVASIIS